VDVWIPKARLEYLPWARYCVRHQEAEERNRESA
jgi:RNA polymerase-binding transcription factor DksA